MKEGALPDIRLTNGIRPNLDHRPEYDNSEFEPYLRVVVTARQAAKVAFKYKSYRTNNGNSTIAKRLKDHHSPDLVTKEELRQWSVEFRLTCPAKKKEQWKSISMDTPE
ncbi:hypothetical protein PG984_005347 [Apiospora sp. TS-2023a]